MHHMGTGGHFGFSLNLIFFTLGAPNMGPIWGRIQKKDIKMYVGHPFEKQVNNKVTYPSKILSKYVFQKGLPPCRIRVKYSGKTISIVRLVYCHGLEKIQQGSTYFYSFCNSRTMFTICLSKSIANHYLTLKTENKNRNKIIRKHFQTRSEV